MSLGGIGFSGLMDSSSDFFGGQDVYYRWQNFDPADPANSEILALGLTEVDVTKTVTDTIICPQPDVDDASFRNIADAASAGVKLRADAKRISISNTWVSIMQAKLALSDPKQVFTDRRFIGLVTENRLFSADNITKDLLFGQIVTWHILGNGNEIK